MLKHNNQQALFYDILYTTAGFENAKQHININQGSDIQLYEKDSYIQMKDVWKIIQKLKWRLCQTIGHTNRIATWKFIHHIKIYSSG